MNADQRLDELLSGLQNYERTRALVTDWSLDTAHALLEGFAVRPSGGHWIQVGGSKGKGTTVLYLEALARAAGLRTGAFMSPHLQHVRERIRVDGLPVQASVLLQAMEGVLDKARQLGLEPSFFEAMTVAAVRIFVDAGLDVVALEVGLGGRLDATTAVPVDGTILTRMEIEHADLLGASLTQIAGEKAHIMRPGKPAWIQPDPAVDQLFRDHADRVGADLREVPEVAELVPTVGGFSGILRTAEFADRFELVGASAFELPALALSHACLRNLCPSGDWPLQPVARPTLPGRFEVLAGSDGWPFVLDGAHTPGSAEQVVAELERRFSQQSVALLFACAIGKQWREILSAFLPLVDRFFITPVEGTAVVPAAEVVEWLHREGKPKAQVVGNPKVGLDELKRCSAIRLVCGSFYLVGSARTHLLHDD